MPLLSATTKNAMLDSLVVAELSLHSDYSPVGDFEIVGGVPAYVRLAVIFDVAAGGKRALLGVPLSFDVPPSIVAWVGMWDGSGGFMGMTPNGGDVLRPFALANLDTIISASHGFLVNDTLIFWGGGAGPLPDLLSEGVIYYVVGSDVDAFQVSSTPAGTPIVSGVSGNGYLQRIIPVEYVGQGVFPVRSLSLDATVAA